MEMMLLSRTRSLKNLQNILLRMEKHVHFSSWKFLKNHQKKIICKILFLVNLCLWVFKNAEIQDQYHSTRWLVDPPFRALVRWNFFQRLQQLAFSWTTEVDWKSAFWKQPQSTQVNRLRSTEINSNRLRPTQTNWNLLKSTEPVQSTWVGFSWFESVSVDLRRFTWVDCGCF